MPVDTKSVYFIGALPPPLGGVTVFNERKSRALRREGLDVRGIEPVPSQLFSVIRALLARDGEVFLSASNILVFLLVALTRSASRVVFFDHNASRLFLHERGWKGWVRKYVLRHVREIRIVNGHLLENYRHLPFFDQLTFQIESAFLPPDPADEAGIIAGYEPRLRSALKEDKRVFVIVSAFKPALDSSGTDIYGLEKCLEAFSELSTEYDECIFLIAVARFTGDRFSSAVLAHATALVEERGNVLLLSGQTILWPLFKKGVLFVRPTTTDGDAVSVREALHFGCAVLASDVVPRPEGVHTFNLNRDSLVEAIREHLELQSTKNEADISASN